MDAGQEIPRKQRMGATKLAVRRYLLTHPSATVEEVVKATRASSRTVGRTRKELLREGKIAPAATGRPPDWRPPTIVTDVTSPPLPSGVSGALSPEEVEAKIRRDIEAAVSGGKVLSREERRVRLSAFADHPLVPHMARIAALRELEATEPKSDTILGPGAPQTREEAITRGALILEAIRDIYDMTAANQTYEKAFGVTVPVDVGIIHVPMHVSEYPIVASKLTSGTSDIPPKNVTELFKTDPAIVEHICKDTPAFENDATPTPPAESDGQDAGQ